jgi:hypothetical protein
MSRRRTIEMRFGIVKTFDRDRINAKGMT